MKSESSLILSMWELIKEGVPAARRTDLAISILRNFEEYGFDSSDMSDILDEDDHLTAAFRAIFGGDEDEETDDDYRFED